MKEEIQLQRDTCKKCLELKKQGRKNSLGEQMYCSQGHAYELSNIKRSQAIQNLRKEIFDTIYQWGYAGIVVNEDAPVIKEMLDRLEQTWY